LIPMKKAASIDRESANSIWSIECHRVCVIVAAHLASASLAHGAARATSEPTSGQSSQSFSVTLQAASKASQEAESANAASAKAGRRQKSASEEAQASNAASDGRAEASPVPPQQTVPQTQATNPDAAPSQALVDGAESSADGLDGQAMRDDSAASLASNIAQSGAGQGGSESQDAKAAIATQNSVAKAALNASTNGLLNGDTAPGVHGAPTAFTRGAAASTASGKQAGQPLQSAAPDQSKKAMDLSASSRTADQLASLIPPSGGSAATVLTTGPSSHSASTDTSAAIGKDGSNNATNDATGLKHHEQSTSDQTGTQAGSQGAASSGDQSQGGASSQGQSAVVAPVNFTNHAAAVLSSVQDTAAGSPAPSASTLAGATASAAKAPENAASASAAQAQALPVINTAKLIQSMGQSEMRVGMHSNEFGSISISTSSTRDSISAQISLDHGELAKVLAAHLPEMQAKFGGHRAMDVRIDMNGERSGQGTGTSGSMSNGSAGQSGQSHEGRQQSGNAVPSYAGGSVVESQLSPVAATPAAGYGRLDARLDITV
jgi:hypothetical protein